MAWKNVQYENGKYRTNEGGGGGGSSTFAGLDDVNFTNLQNGQVPKYNSTTQKWENADESGGGGTVTDVKVDGQSVVDPQTGEAEITMPTPPTIPVEDVEVNGESVVNAQKVAEIKSYKEVTQAEYNALPDSKLNDGILYAIKDSAGADGFPPLIYSDEEREVGVWRDGKPLYQKTIIINSVISGNNIINHGIDSADEIVSAIGTFFSNANDSAPIPNGHLQSAWSLTMFDFGVTNFKVSVGSSWVQYLDHIQVTLQYTKTTDTPGSGTWTTQGALAHHYSTTEQEIGTWIDGKTIYEKVMPVTTTAGLYRLDVSALNIDYVVFIKVRIQNANNLSHSYVDSPYWYSNTDWFRYYFPENNSAIIFESGSAFSYGSGYVILQYTKTTD